MMIAFCKLSGNNALSETAIAIWNQYQEFVDTISGIYDFMWNTNYFNQDFQPNFKVQLIFTNYDKY